MKIDIQNGWILSVLLLTVSYMPLLFSKQGRKRLTTFSFMSKKGRNLSFLISLLFIAMLVLPFFHTISENPVQFYTGTAITLIGTLGVLISFHNYFTTESNQLITKGLYRISRNPIYVFTIVLCVGIGVLCGMYEMIPVLLLYVIAQHPIIKEEEEFCEKEYGDEYLVYKRKTPRYLLIK